MYSESLPNLKVTTSDVPLALMHIAIHSVLMQVIVQTGTSFWGTSTTTRFVRFYKLENNCINMVVPL